MDSAKQGTRALGLQRSRPLITTRPRPGLQRVQRPGRRPSLQSRSRVQISVQSPAGCLAFGCHGAYALHCYQESIFLRSFFPPGPRLTLALPVCRSLLSLSSSLHLSKEHGSTHFTVATRNVRPRVLDSRTDAAGCSPVVPCWTTLLRAPHSPRLHLQQSGAPSP